MNELEIRAESENRIWANNPVLTQLLGLSPVLAISSSLAFGVGLGIATFLVCVFSCLSASLLQKFIPHEWRLLWFMLILASYTTVAEAIVQIYFYPLSLRLGLYMPLICCNIAILTRMETVSTKTSWALATLDAAKTGFGFLVVLVLFSASREFLSSGTLFSHWQLLLPAGSELITTASNSDDAQQFRFVNTQAGAFILLGMLIALSNAISKLSSTTPKTNSEDLALVRRARVTGRLSKE